MNQVIQGRKVPMPVVHTVLFLKSFTNVATNENGIPYFHCVFESVSNRKVSVVVTIEPEVNHEGKFIWKELSPKVANMMLGEEIRGSIVDTGNQFIYIP